MKLIQKALCLAAAIIAVAVVGPVAAKSPCETRVLVDVNYEQYTKSIGPDVTIRRLDWELDDGHIYQTQAGRF